MSWNLIQKEIGRNRNRFLLWMLIIGLFMIITMMMIPTMLGASSFTASYLKMFPKAMLDGFGMNTDTWGSLLGMYATYHVFYSLVFGGIFGISFGGDILAKEENRKTADFLLTRPLSRAQIVASKLVVLVLYILLLNLGITATGWIGLAAASTQPWSLSSLLVLNLESFLLTLLFGTLGLFLSVLGRRGRSFAGVGTGVVLVAYFLDGLAKAFEKARDFGWVSPFWFVNTKVTSPDYGLEWWRVLCLVGLSVLFCALTFAKYRRKDILV